MNNLWFVSWHCLGAAVNGQHSTLSDSANMEQNYDHCHKGLFQPYILMFAFQVNGEN